MTKRDNFTPGNWKSSGVMMIMMMMMMMIFVGFTLPRIQYLRLNSALCCMISKLNENLTGRDFGLEQRVDLLR
jgi:hypothetical protein